MGQQTQVCIFYFIHLFFVMIYIGFDAYREAVNRPIAVPDSASVTRSPTGSIRTIASTHSSRSDTSNGSRSTVFVPPLSSLPDIDDFNSTFSGLSRHSSIVSSHHTRTVDDTVIQNQEYVYPGDPRVITPSRGNSRRRSGSMTDLDEEFRSAINRARGTGGGFLGASPVTISSGSSLGKNIFVTPPPTTSRRSDISDENFFSAGSSDSARSSYYSHSSITGGPRTTTGLASMTPVTSATSETQLPSTFTPSTFASSALTPSYGFTEVSSTHSAGSDVSFADSPSTLSRAREIRRRFAGTARTYSSGYLTDASRSESERDNDDREGDGSRSPSGTFTPGSVHSSLSGSYSGGGRGSLS